MRLQFQPIPDGDLDGPEQARIAEMRRQFTLRNRDHNLGHQQKSTLDDWIDPPVQRTWLDNGPELDMEAIQNGAVRSTGGAKVIDSGLGPRYLSDLAAIIELFIPTPVATEARFWSLTDWPSTGRGRGFTLSTGGMELAYASRPGSSAVTVLNAPEGAFLGAFGFGAAARLRAMPSRRRARQTGHPYAQAKLRRTAYRTAFVDQLVVPVGTLAETLAAIETPQQTAEDIRRLALSLMRQRATPWANSHSSGLAAAAYGAIVGRGERLQLPEYGVFCKN